MQALVRKRMESVTNPGVTDRVIHNLGYFEKPTDDWGDAFVLRVCSIIRKSTYTNVSVVDMAVSEVSRVTNMMNGSIPSTDTYVSVNDDRTFNLGVEVTTLYKKQNDKVRPVNRPHELGLKPEGVENWN